MTAVPLLNAEHTLHKAVVTSAVILAHVVGLVWVVNSIDITEPATTPPSVIGVLIAPEPRPVAKPEPVVKPVVKPQPKPQPKTEPVKATPQPAPVPVAPAPSPIPAPAPAPVAAPAAPPPAAPVQATAPVAEPLPVTPPRTDASHLNNPPPAYPPMSRRLGEQGRVMLDVYILPDGSVGELKLKTSSGFTRLDESAMAAVRKWKYVPAKRGGQPIAFWYVQPVSFVLNQN